MFFAFFNLYEWYQISQSISYLLLTKNNFCKYFAQRLLALKLQEVIILLLMKTLNLRAFILSGEMWTVLAIRHWSVQRHCSRSNFCPWAHRLHSQDTRSVQGGRGFHLFWFVVRSIRFLNKFNYFGLMFFFGRSCVFNILNI